MSHATDTNEPSPTAASDARASEVRASDVRSSGGFPRRLATVIRHELGQRWLALPVAVVLALVVIVAPWLPGLSGQPAHEVREGTALVLTLLLSWGLALWIGATTVAPDLAAGRLGFYLSRPLSTWTLWVGKSLAGLGLAAACGALVWLAGSLGPGSTGAGVGSLAGPESPWTALLVPGNPVDWLLGLLLVFTFGHLAALAVRERSAWLLVDLAGLGVTLILALGLALRLAGEGAFEPLVRLERFGALAVAVVAWGVSGLALARGRTSLVAHRRLAAPLLWGGVVAIVLVLGAWTSATLTVAPGEVEHIESYFSRAVGPWAMITAQPRAGEEWLVDVVVGAEGEVWMHLDQRPVPDLAVAASSDGRRLAWVGWQGAMGIENTWRFGQIVLRGAELTVDEPQPLDLGVRYPAFPDALALAPAGDRVYAVVQSRGTTTLFVHELAWGGGAGRLLASAPLPDHLSPPVLVADRDRGVRVLATVPRFDDGDDDGGDGFATGWRLEAWRLDAGERRARRSGVEPLPGPLFWNASADASRVAVIDGSRVRILEGPELVETGSVDLADPVGPTAPGAGGVPSLRFGRFLADGRLVVERRLPATGQRELVVLAPDASVVSARPTPGDRLVFVASEPAPGEVLLSYAASGGVGTVLWSVDVPGADGLEILGEPGTSLRPLVEDAGPAIGASRLLVRGAAELVRLDPETAELKALSWSS